MEDAKSTFIVYEVRLRGCGDLKILDVDIIKERGEPNPALRKCRQLIYLN